MVSSSHRTATALDRAVSNLGESYFVVFYCIYFLVVNFNTATNLKSAFISVLCVTSDSRDLFQRG